MTMTDSGQAVLPHSLRALVRAIVNHDTIAAALVQQSYEAHARHQALNSLAAHDFDAARAQAARLDASPQVGPLHGIPITVKDLYQADGFPTRAGTRAPLPDLGPREATAVRRLRRAGAIVLGKTNLHEIAAGISGENPWTGPVRNPHDLTRQAGGSSGGAAASLAAGIGLAALGSDTAGSIRIPASFCGVVGFKPSYGLIPLDGALPLSWTCDHAGPLARSVDDAHLLTEVLAARRLPLRPADQHSPTRVGVPARLLDGWLGEPVARAFAELRARVDQTARVRWVDIDIPGLGDALPPFSLIRGAESAHVHRAALDSHPKGFSDAVREKLLEGRAISGAAYLGALDFRNRLRDALDEALQTVDALLLPTTALPAPPIGATEVLLRRGMTDHRQAYLRFTLPFSLTGLPALALPMPGDGPLPLSAQIVGPFGADARVIEIGLWLEKTLAG
jgi:aspartyl-tRNA(Asn)/glutamyl-tRNA(Gln) amidotransferase subunit A